MAVIDDNIDLHTNESNQMPQFEHTQKVLLHALYRALRTQCDTLEEFKG